MFLTVLDTRHTLVVYAEVTSPVSLDPHASFSVWLVTHSECPHLCQVHHRAGKCWHCSTIRLVPRHNDIWKYINKRNTPQQIFIVCLCAFATLFKFISDLYKICKDDIKLTSIIIIIICQCVMSPHPESIWCQFHPAPHTLKLSYTLTARPPRRDTLIKLMTLH